MRRYVRSHWRGIRLGTHGALAAQKLGGTHLVLLTQGKGMSGFVFQQYAHLQYWLQSLEPLQFVDPQACRPVGEQAQAGRAALEGWPINVGVSAMAAV